MTCHCLKKKIIISNHVFIQFEKYPSTPPNRNKQKSPGDQVCSSPEFQRKVNDSLVIISVAITQNYLPKVLSPAFSQYKCYFFVRVVFKLVDTVNVKGDLGGSTKQLQLDYETCYQTNRTVIWSENLISLAWNFTNLTCMYNNYYQDLLLLIITEGYLEYGQQR